MPFAKSITIVGGGLAGLTLGIGLRQRSVPVTIQEAANYPRHRVCGSNKPVPSAPRLPHFFRRPNQPHRICCRPLPSVFRDLSWMTCWQKSFVNSAVK
jgi:NADPH-dependent 2,4-dienoyl-CoA reductase/sulfur reductase-like enzyme